LFPWFSAEDKWDREKALEAEAEHAVGQVDVIDALDSQQRGRVGGPRHQHQDLLVIVDPVVGIGLPNTLWLDSFQGVGSVAGIPEQFLQFDP
jgi:hypothetical protein